MKSIESKAALAVVHKINTRREMVFQRLVNDSSKFIKLVNARSVSPKPAPIYDYHAADVPDPNLGAAEISYIIYTNSKNNLFTNYNYKFHYNKLL